MIFRLHNKLKNVDIYNIKPPVNKSVNEEQIVLKEDVPTNICLTYLTNLVTREIKTTLRFHLILVRMTGMLGQ